MPVGRGLRRLERVRRSDQSLVWRARLAGSARHVGDANVLSCQVFDTLVAHRSGRVGRWLH
jgi:hypothetical protein